MTFLVGVANFWRSLRYFFVADYWRVFWFLFLIGFYLNRLNSYFKGMHRRLRLKHLRVWKLHLQAVILSTKQKLKRNQYLVKQLGRLGRIQRLQSGQKVRICSPIFSIFLFNSFFLHDQWAWQLSEVSLFVWTDVILVFFLVLWHSHARFFSVMELDLEAWYALLDWTQILQVFIYTLDNKCRIHCSYVSV